MANKTTVTTIVQHDELRVNGIRANGYGQLPKIVMLDSALPLESKAIYAYFASYTGGGNTKAFPGRDKIIHDLGVTKDTYYKYFKKLTEDGYISVEQKNGKEAGKGFTHNIYTLESYPEKFSSVPEDANENMRKAYSYIQKAKDITAAGYGNIPKAIMTDTSISLQAKGLYAYLCVFSGENYMAAPSRDTILFHLGIAAHAYSKYAKILEGANYITKQQTTNGGHFGAVVYCLVQNPALFAEEKEEKSPCVEFSDTIVSDSIKSDAVFSSPMESDTISSDSEKSYSMISDTNKTNPLPKTKNNNNCLINQSVCKSQTPKQNYGLTDKKQAFELINGLRSLDTSANNETADLFFTALEQMLTTETGTNIQNFTVPAKQVEDFFSLPVIADNDSRCDFISEVCSRYDSYSLTKEIKNPVQYMKSIIWSTVDFFRRRKPVDETVKNELIYGRPLPSTLRKKSHKASAEYGQIENTTDTI